MGCNHSSNEDHIDSGGDSGAALSRKNSPSHSQQQQQQQQRDGSNSGGVSRSVADDARSFRSKLGAIKMLTRNEKSRSALLDYLQQVNKQEILVCYQDLEEIKLCNEEQAFTRVSALIWRYKTIYEGAKILETRTKNVEVLLWDALGKLRTLDSNPVSHVELIKFITIAQNDLLSRLIIPFESFLNSSCYKEWQQSQISDEVHVRRQSQQRNRAIETNSVQLSHHSQSQQQQQQPLSSAAASVCSSKTQTFSVSHPDVLIVDDSTVTLKLTGLTLERDGHTVERAHNGQEALQLLKSRMYHIVLIDLNMPVMDGFETVRLFREYERSNEQNYLIAAGGLLDEDSDRLSSLSADSGEEEVLSVGRSSSLAAAAGVPSTAAATTAAATATAGGRNNSRGSTSGRPQQQKQASYRNGLSNREAAKQVLGLRRGLTAAHYHQLIIGMSTNVDENTRRRAFAAGMDDFLPKPFTLQKFVETIRQAQRVVDEKTAAQKAQRDNTAAAFAASAGADGASVTQRSVLVTANELFEP